MRFANLNNTSTNDIYTRYIFIRGVNLKTYTKSEIILTTLGLKNCFFILFMKLIIALINIKNYCFIYV